MFLNRQHAGKLLAGRLKEQMQAEAALPPAIIVALPRGGVPIAAEIALELKCPLDLLVSKKIRAPDNPELAIGAVSSSGVVVLDEQMPYLFGCDNSYRDAQRNQSLQLVEETREQEQFWLEAAGIATRPEWKGKLVILADDGIATGMTTLAALRTVKRKEARQVWLAAPVAPYDTCLKLKQECDKLVVLSMPFDFSAVGGFYVDFHQVADDEVVAAIKRVCSQSAAPASQ